MALRMTATDVKQIENGLWALTMPPHQIRHFGTPGSSIGSKSVLIFNAFEYDAENELLHFDAGDVTPLNIGTTSKVIAIAAQPLNDDAAPQSDAFDVDPQIFGPGDQEFLRLTGKELTKDMAHTAKTLLTLIRQKSPGNLKRGKSRNFSETPDNFWYVIVQPRINELSITVRGDIAHFEGVADLEIKDDRGNTRFKVQNEQDVQSALKLIFHAVRKQ